jgi:hypothetical protein
LLFVFAAFVGSMRTPKVLRTRNTALLCGTPGRTRTYNLRIRSPLLYPIELRGLREIILYLYRTRFPGHTFAARVTHAAALSQ